MRPRPNRSEEFEILCNWLRNNKCLGALASLWKFFPVGIYPVNILFQLDAPGSLKMTGTVSFQKFYTASNTVVVSFLRRVYTTEKLGPDNFYKEMLEFSEGHRDLHYFFTNHVGTLLLF